VMLLVGSEALASMGLAPLLRVLQRALPLCVLLVDDGTFATDRSGGLGGLGGLAGLASVLALAQGQVSVLSSAVSRPDHLVVGLRDALSSPRPSLLHVLAPSPQRCGLAPGDMLKHAELLVEDGAHAIFSVAEGAAAVDAVALAGGPDAASRLLHALLDPACHDAVGLEPPEAAAVISEVSSPDAAAVEALRDALSAEHVDRLHARLLALAGIDVGRGSEGGAA